MATEKQEQRASLAWFISMLRGVSGANSTKARMMLGAEVFRGSKEAFLGGMFFMGYDPKTKDKLPYWDKFPLVIPIGFYPDGFLGLNLHYLPPMQRKQLLTQLLKFKKKAGTPSAYMRLSYQLLSAVAKSSLFQPCIHRYLFSHVTTEFVMVHDSGWSNAVMLPVHQFQGASARKVWSQR